MKNTDLCQACGELIPAGDLYCSQECALAQGGDALVISVLDRITATPESAAAAGMIEPAPANPVDTADLIHSIKALKAELEALGWTVKMKITPPQKQLSPDEEKMNKRIDVLDLSLRVYNALKRTGISTVGEVLKMLEHGPYAMLHIRNFGEKSRAELVQRLLEKNFIGLDHPIVAVCDLTPYMLWHINEGN